MAEDDEEKEEQQYLGVEILEAVEKAIKKLEALQGTLLDKLGELEGIRKSLITINANIEILNNNQVKMAEKLGLSVEE